jgi:hypothetical protein
VKESWLKEMEQTNRSLGGDLPIDIFLPELRALTDQEPAPAVEEPEPIPELPRRSARPGRGTATAARPAAVKAKKQVRATAEQTPEEVAAEIEEFMNRNQRGPSEDDDYSQFMGSGMDPNLDPE